MIRRLTHLIHHRCRHQIEGLADAAHHQTQLATTLAADLAADEMAHSHLLDEIHDACTRPDRIEEAYIPDVLHAHLVDYQAIRRELAEAHDALDRLTNV